MSLDALLARLEVRSVTPVTDGASGDVMPNPKKSHRCTAVTPVTAKALIATLPYDLAADAWDYFRERAAIAEYEGELSRSDADLQARLELQAIRNQGLQND